MAWRPHNFLLITVDGLRADYLGCNGHPRINSWYIDRLAKEGVRFNRCYSVSPMPGPAQVSFATSTYPGEHQYLSPQARVPASLPSLHSCLKEADYKLGFFGENNYLTHRDLLATFDEVSALPQGYLDDHQNFLHASSAFTLPMDHPLNRSARFGAEAACFMRRHSGRPFFTWLNLREPSPPYAAPPPYDFLFDDDVLELPAGWPRPQNEEEPRRSDAWRVHSDIRNREDDDIRRLTSVYMGMIRMVDDIVGKILKDLDDLNLRQNTVVLFVSTHGDLLGYRGLLQQIPVFYEPLIRVPAILRHPEGTHAGSVYRGQVETIDLAPTVLDMLGMVPPPSMVGKNRWRDMDMDDDIGNEIVFSQGGIAGEGLTEPRPETKQKKPQGEILNGSGAMVRRANWKLAFYEGDTPEMFDLEKDPEELENLYENPNFIDIRDELTTELARKLLSLKKRSGQLEAAESHESSIANPLGFSPRLHSEPEPPKGYISEIIKRDIEVNPAEKRRTLTAPMKLASAPGVRKKSKSTRIINQVLFICTGNHYRSRFAEAVFNYYADVLNLRYSSFSRGLDINRITEEAHISPLVLEALEERTINPKYISPSRVQLSLEDLTRAERIIALDETEHRPLMRDRFPDWTDRIEYWDIRDIEHASAEVSLSSIEHLVSDLVRQLDGVAGGSQG